MSLKFRIGCENGVDLEITRSAVTRLLVLCQCVLCCCSKFGELRLPIMVCLIYTDHSWDTCVTFRFKRTNRYIHISGYVHP
jgi:hypothetical protein